MDSIIFQTSLIAAFVAGMVALFAPCCITFLLPAYLGSVFREKEKVVFMTLVFGSGIFIVLLPAVIGVAIISKLLFRFHNEVYLVSGILMLAISFISFLGIKLPMPQIPGRNIGGKVDVFSIFTLGIFSGITSACCAPVLIGILTFALLSPNFFGALLIGAVYVLGMITPLLFISTFLSGRIEKLVILRKIIFSLSFLGKTYGITLSNMIAGLVFLATGFLTIFLTVTGRLSMEKMSGVTQIVQNVGNSTGQAFGSNLILNIIFVLVVLYLIQKIVRRA